MAAGLLEFCVAQAGALRRDIETLVGHESPSHDKAAVDRCGAVVARMLRDAGAAVTLMPQRRRGDHIRAEFAGGPRRVLVLGHFDTVWDVGQLERMPIREADGRLFGPGVFDMKAGIAVSVLAVRALAGAARPRVVMLWTTDEEVGSGTSRSLIEYEAQQSDAVLVLEPSLPGGAVKTQRKGCGEFVLTVHGVSAHAGIDPTKGASAIHEIARQIVALESLRDPARGISVNVGLVSGGTRANVVAERAEATIDVRVPTAADAQRIETAIRALRPQHPEVRLEVCGGVERPPLERTAGVVRLYEQARLAARDLGRDLQEGSTGGGSDGNFTAALGVPTLDGLGPEGDGAHALHEHVLVADLPWRAALLARLMARINGVE
ncbi:MAG TPA: M20 family metallopeptidase [Vicinamibacterales bacterium]|nr:M20 family metallopeptidase [Vicinamibacterales bacterium]